MPRATERIAATAAATRTATAMQQQELVGKEVGGTILEPSRTSGSKAMEDKRGLMICRTCGKEREHWTFQCPDKYLSSHAEAFLDMSPSIDGLARSSTCSICLQATDRHQANVLRHRAYLMRRRAEAMRRGSGAEVTRRSHDRNSICVTNLPENTSQRDLCNLASPFGVVSNLDLTLDERNGSRRQLGIVQFAQRKSAEAAISRLNGYSFGGLSLKAEWKTPPLKDVQGLPKICAVCVRAAESCIRVTNLPEKTCERDLYNLASPFGVIIGFHLALDKKNKSRRQLGVVKFDQRKCAEVAISWLDGYVYGALDLQAELASPNDLVVFSATN